MSFFEIFSPGMRHWRQQQDLEKVLVVDQHKGGHGPKPLDLDSGTVELVMPRRPATKNDDASSGESEPSPNPGSAQNRDSPEKPDQGESPRPETPADSSGS